MERFIERQPLPPEQQKVVELYKKGIRGRRLEEETAYSFAGIHHVLNRVGVEKAPTGRPRIDREEIKNRLQQAEFNGLRGELKLLWAANLAGCSVTTVRRAQRES